MGIYMPGCSVANRKRVLMKPQFLEENRRTNLCIMLFMMGECKVLVMPVPGSEGLVMRKGGRNLPEQ